MQNQRTIAHSISCSGIGLHRGDMVNITLHPAAENSGIVFVRSDVVDRNNKVPASYENVVNTTLGTTIQNAEGVSVATVEHIMAAFWGARIDNCIVEMDGGEIPIMDGSSEPFVFLIECAGVKEQLAPRRVVEILKEITVRDEEKGAFLSLYPGEGFVVNMEIDFGDGVIANQRSLFDAKRISFKNDVARARTFGFAKEVDYLRASGLAKGGSLENAIVVGDDGIINKEGLRYHDEFVRHKVLDCIGDLYLSGAMIEGYVHGYKSGHCLNTKLLKTLFATPDAWRFKQPKADPQLLFIQTPLPYQPEMTA